jgi:CubicO group peptidase (beta-lactamase class C family)
MPGLREAFDRIGLALEHHLPVTHAAGIALAVTDREEVLGVVVRGVADAAAGTAVGPETRFQIGSISKSFAAIVTLQEAEIGRLDLDVSINEILPWLELPEPFGPITLHHLLTHTSGLAIGTEESPTTLGAAGMLRSIPPTFAPGDRYGYSNDGYKLVGLALERVAGMPVQALLRERVFGPLGMASSVAAITEAERADIATGYAPMFTDRPPQLTHPLVPAPWIHSNSADGSIVSNVIDMSAYARLLLAGGDVPDGRGGRILSANAFERLTTTHVVVPEDPDFDYGYGLDLGEIDGVHVVGHSGGMVGYTALMRLLPEEGLGCVALQNGDGDKSGVVTYALDAVRAALQGEDLPEPWVPRDPEQVDDPEVYAGRYEGDARSIDVEALDDGRLRLRAGPVGVVLQRDPLEPPGDSFLVPHPSLEKHLLTFGRNDAGMVVEAFHGGDWFRGATLTGDLPPHAPAEWAAHAGLYRSNDPWYPAIRVVLRKGRLAASVSLEAPEEELTPLADGSFAVGELWMPRRMRFHRVVDGRTTIVEYNGGRWYRSFEE